jgi:hypothetical protein
MLVTSINHSMLHQELIMSTHKETEAVMISQFQAKRVLKTSILFGIQSFTSSQDTKIFLSAPLIGNQMVLMLKDLLQNTPLVQRVKI